MKKILLICAMVIGSYAANCQNITVGGTIDADTTWVADTVFVDDDITIADDVTLTISPGVVVIFNDFYRILVEGTIISKGTETKRIKYTVMDTSGYYEFSHTGWNGIDFEYFEDMDNNDTSYFTWSDFSFASEWDDSQGGAAIRIEGYSKIIIDHCTFTYNYAYLMGGAISIQSEAEPVISNCLFSYNTAQHGGGAINVGCYDEWETFDQPVIKNCIFTHNQSLYDDRSYYGGGAIKLSGYTDALVINNYFADNSSSSQGGAMISSGYANPWVINNVFKGNEAIHNGGAIAIKYYAGGYFLNNTIMNNTSANGGGAISIGCENDSAVFANNIIRGNSAVVETYNQFYIGAPDEFIKIYNNNIEGGLGYLDTLVIHADNIDEDPLMVNPENGNFMLKCGSPCIDAAKDTFNYFPVLDIAGKPRKQGNAYDMGAYETQFPQVNLGEDKTIAYDGTATLDAGPGFSSYRWNTGEETQKKTVEGTVLGAGNHTFSVTVTNEYACEDNDEIVVTVEEQPPVGINNPLTADIKVFPNPNSGRFTITAPNAVIYITDMSGRNIKTLYSDNSVTVDLSTEAKGIYFIKIEGHNYNKTFKMVIQ